MTDIVMQNFWSSLDEQLERSDVLMLLNHDNEQAWMEMTSFLDHHSTLWPIIETEIESNPTRKAKLARAFIIRSNGAITSDKELDPEISKNSLKTIEKIKMRDILRRTKVDQDTTLRVLRLVSDGAWIRLRHHTEPAPQYEPEPRHDLTEHIPF